MPSSDPGSSVGTGARVNRGARRRPRCADDEMVMATLGLPDQVVQQAECAVPFYSASEMLSRSVVPNGVILTLSTFDEWPAMVLPYHIGIEGMSSAR